MLIFVKLRQVCTQHIDDSIELIQLQSFERAFSSWNAAIFVILIAAIKIGLMQMSKIPDKTTKQETCLLFENLFLLQTKPPIHTQTVFCYLVFTKKCSAYLKIFCLIIGLTYKN